MNTERNLQAEVATRPYTFRQIDKAIWGVNYFSHVLREGVVVDERLAISFVAAPRLIKLGFWQIADGKLLGRQQLEDLKYSKAYELEYPDLWKIFLRGYMVKGGLAITLAGIEDKYVTSAKQAGIELPPPWTF